MKRFLLHTVAHQGQKRGWFNLSLGLKMLRDKSVPVKRKLLCLGAGIGIMLLLQLLELPIEALLAALLPLVAIPLIAILDGLEILILPILFAALLLSVGQKPLNGTVPPRLR